MEIGIFTFAETHVDPRDRRAARCRRADPRSPRGDRAGGPGRPRRLRGRASTTAPTTPCPRRRGARRGGRPDEAHPSHQRRLRAQLRRPGARLPGLRHPRPDLEGRAEIMAGRGSFIESFPLFGQDLEDYDELFAEKLELLLTSGRTSVVTWQGSRHRRAHRGPRWSIRDPSRIRSRSGSPWAGHPSSVVRAATPRASHGSGHHRGGAGALRALRGAVPRCGGPSGARRR